MDLRGIRQKFGLTLTYVASKTGIPRYSLERYQLQKRKLPVQAAKRLGKFYGQDWWTFYEQEDEK